MSEEKEIYEAQLRINEAMIEHKIPQHIAFSAMADILSKVLAKSPEPYYSRQLWQFIQMAHKPQKKKKGKDDE